jgi:hypothetical protein
LGFGDFLVRFDIPPERLKTWMCTKFTNQRTGFAQNHFSYAALNIVLKYYYDYCDYNDYHRFYHYYHYYYYYDYH